MRALALLALLTFGACAHTSCPEPKLRPPAGPFLWEVTGGTGTVYLYGTLHVAGRDDVAPSARQALGRSKRFVDEMAPLPPDEVRERARLPRGQSLDQLIGADDW